MDYRNYEALDKKPVQLSEIAGIRLAHLLDNTQHAERMITFNYPLDKPVETPGMVVRTMVEEEVLYHPAKEAQRLQLNGGDQIAKELAKTSDELKEMFGLN